MSWLKWFQHPESVRTALTRRDDRRGATIVNAGDDFEIRQARHAIVLALSSGWVNRRVETFTFLDAVTVRRRMSVDLTLAPTRSLDDGEQALVPLMTLAKEDLRNLDVRGPDGQPVPVLNTQQNGTAAVAGLESYLEELASREPADRDVDVDLLTKIVMARPSDTPAPIAPHAIAAGGALYRQLRHADDRRRRALETLIEELEETFLLLVPAKYSAAGRRFVFKVSYDAENRTQHASRLSRLATTSNRVFSSIGWAARTEFFDGLAVGLAQSYHAEGVAPRDAYIADAFIQVRRPGRTVDEDPVLDSHRFRPHLHVASTERSAIAHLTLAIRARQQELLVPLALTSSIISVVLGLTPANAENIDKQTFAALLLVPFALAAYYIRGQENSYMTKMLFGVRALAALPVVAVYALTLEAIGKLPPPSGQRISDATLDQLRWLFPVAAIPTVILVCAFVGPPAGRYVIRPAMRWMERRGRDAVHDHTASKLRRTLAASVPAGAAIIVTLVTIAALIYILCLGTDAWLNDAPSVVTSIVSKR